MVKDRSRSLSEARVGCASGPGAGSSNHALAASPKAAIPTWAAPPPRRTGPPACPSRLDPPLAIGERTFPGVTVPALPEIGVEIPVDILHARGTGASSDRTDVSDRMKMLAKTTSWLQAGSGRGIGGADAGIGPVLI